MNIIFEILDLFLLFLIIEYGTLILWKKIIINIVGVSNRIIKLYSPIKKLLSEKQISIDIFITEIL